MANTGISHLNESMQKTNEWLKEVAKALNSDDTEQAYSVTRAVLHALRDRLTVEEATDLAAQLPLVLKGVYYDGYNPTRVPVKYSTQDELIERVGGELRNLDVVEIDLAIRAVFSVLKNRVSEGEMEDILGTMPREIKELLA